MMHTRTLVSSAGVYNPPPPLLPVDINGIPFGLGEMARRQDQKGYGWSKVTALYNDRTLTLLSSDGVASAYDFDNGFGRGWEVQSRTPALVTITRTVTFTGTPAQIAAFKSNYEETKRRSEAHGMSRLGWHDGLASVDPPTGVIRRVSHYSESTS